MVCSDCAGTVQIAVDCKIYVNYAIFSSINEKRRNKIAKNAAPGRAALAVRVARDHIRLVAAARLAQMRWM
jgi:hypothetical protein